MARLRFEVPPMRKVVLAPPEGSDSPTIDMLIGESVDQVTAEAKASEYAQAFKDAYGDDYTFTFDPAFGV